MSDYDPNADARRVLQVNAAGTVVAPAAAVTGTAADAQADAAANVHQARTFTFNGTTWDRQRGWNASGGTQGTAGIALALPALVDSGNNIRPQFALAALTDGTNGNNVAGVGGFVWNGVTADRIRNTAEATLLASAARTTTQVSADIPTYNARNLQVVLDMTVAGTGSVTVLIEGKDSASGKYFTLLSGVAVVTNITSRYKVGPDIVAVANVVAQEYLPRFVRITVTANNANSATYSVGYVLGV